MLCVRGKATADGHTYIIKNRDMGMPLEQSLVHHVFPDGLEILEVGGAGILTYPPWVSTATVWRSPPPAFGQKKTPHGLTGWKRQTFSSTCASC